MRYQLTVPADSFARVLFTTLSGSVDVAASDPVGEVVVQARRRDRALSRRFE